VMALEHTALAIQGVQFHPESILSESGDKLLANWLEQLRPWSGSPIRGTGNV
jgi:anthranilate/para-aminobenzoate synthase component II